MVTTFTKPTKLAFQQVNQLGFTSSTYFLLRKLVLDLRVSCCLSFSLFVSSHTCGRALKNYLHIGRMSGDYTITQSKTTQTLKTRTLLLFRPYSLNDCFYFKTVSTLYTDSFGIPPSKGWIVHLFRAFTLAFWTCRQVVESFSKYKLRSSLHWMQSTCDLLALSL